MTFVSLLSYGVTAEVALGRGATPHELNAHESQLAIKFSYEYLFLSNKKCASRLLHSTLNHMVSVEVVPTVTFAIDSFTQNIVST